MWTYPFYIALSYPNSVTVNDIGILRVDLFHDKMQLLQCVNRNNLCKYTNLQNVAICSDLTLKALNNNLNFHPLEVVPRYRDPQLQVGENYSYLVNFRPNICKSQ